MKNFLQVCSGLWLLVGLLCGSTQAHPAALAPGLQRVNLSIQATGVVKLPTMAAPQDGVVKPVADTTGLLITQLSTQALCPGGSLQIYFSAEKPLSATGVVTADLISRRSAAVVSVPVSGTASPLRLTVPDTLVPGSYRLRLRTAGAAGTYAGAININPVPIVNLRGSTTIRRGEPAVVTLDVTGIGPISINLSDGSQVPTEGLERTIFRSVSLFPDTTTTYRVTGLTSGCGTAGTISGSAVVTVQPSVRIDSLSSYRFCGGDTIRAYLSVDSAALGASPAAWAFLIGPPTSATGNLGSYTGYGTVLSIRNRVMTVVLPGPGQGDIYSGVYAVQVRYPDRAEQAQFGVVHNRLVRAGTVPRAILPANFSTELDKPQGINFQVTVTGGRDYEITLSDSTIRRVKTDEDFYTQVARFDLFVDKTTTYTVRSVRNSCGVGTTEGQVTINVRQPDERVLYLKRPDSLYCPGSLLRVSFGISGTYTAANRFRLELSDGLGTFYGNYVDTVRTAADTLQFRVPEEASFYKLRLVATDSGVVSNETGFYVSEFAPKATLAITPDDRRAGYTDGATTVVLPGASAELVLGFQGQPPFRYELSDGTKGQTNATFVSLKRFPQTSATYYLKSLTDGCSTAPASNTVALTVQPFLMQIGTVNSYACLGNELPVPIVTAGRVPDSATLVVQAATDSATGTYRDLPTAGLLPGLRVTVDTAMIGKNLFLRVVARTSSLTLTSLPTASPITVRSAPNVTLTTPDGQTAVQLEPNQTSAELKVASKARDVFSVRLSDNQLLDGFANGSLFVAPASTTAASTFTIQRVYNVCGYGTASGQVRVSYKPGLRGLTATDSLLCAGSSWTVGYERVGELAADNRFVFSLRDSTGQLTRLTETTAVQGQLTLPIPRVQKAGSYSLHVEATSPALTLVNSGPRLVVRALPTASLTGTASVIKGDSAGVSVALTGSAPWSFTVSGPGGSQTVTTGQSPYRIRIRPDTTVTYRLAGVSNGQCGTGIASGTAVITVTILTASEPALPLSVSVYPNPTSSYLRISGQWEGGPAVTLQLIDASGRPVLDESAGRSFGAFAREVDLSPFPTGVYLLRIRVGDRTEVRRVVKQ